MAEWYSTWMYRKSHVIEKASGAGTDHQIRIKVHYGSGTDSNENVYLNGKCRMDFGDIRFTKSDGVTLLDYWMEKKVDGDYAVFWVEIKDDLSNSDVTIYIYYGKNDVTTTSNLKNTFLDEPYHFDTDESDEWGGTAWTWDTANSIIKKSTDIYYSYYISNYNYGRNRKYVARIGRFGSGSDQYFGIVFAFQDNQNFYWVFFNVNENKIYLRKLVNNVSSNVVSASFTTSNETYYDLEINWYSNGRVKVYVDGVLKIDYSSLTDWTSGKFGLRAFGDDINVRCDYVFVAKSLLSPPSHGSWGTEEYGPLLNLYLDRIIGWKEDSVVDVPIKKIPNKIKPSVTAEYYCQRVKRFKITARVSEAHLAKLKSLEQEITYTKKLEDNSTTYNVWIEELRPIWKFEDQYPWLVELQLIELNEE